MKSDIFLRLFCLGCFFPVVFCSALVLSPGQAMAAMDELEWSPQVIDEEVFAKDILEYQVKLKNAGERMLNIYPVVYDIVSEGTAPESVPPSRLDERVSVTSWISFKRGVIELKPGDEAEIPLRIKVDMKAAAGRRHAAIAFPTGPHRNGAEENLREENFPELLINLNVRENIINNAQVRTFYPARNIFIDLPVVFTFTVNNSGNRLITPEGNVFIYDRRGTEVDVIPVNSGGDSVAPDASGEYRIVWQPEGRVMGKFKARLEAEYGGANKRDLQDTVYFWVLPLAYLIMFAAGLLAVIVFATVMIFRKTYHGHHHYLRDLMSHKPKEHVIDLKEGEKKE